MFTYLQIHDIDFLGTNSKLKEYTVHYSNEAPPHSRFLKQSKSSTVSKTALIKCRKNAVYFLLLSHSIYKIPAHTPHTPNCLNDYPLQRLLTSIFMSMIQSKHYLSQNRSTDMHIHSETKSSFCGQQHLLTALNIMQENI